MAMVMLMVLEPVLMGALTAAGRLKPVASADVMNDPFPSFGRPPSGPPSHPFASTPLFFVYLDTVYMYIAYTTSKFAGESHQRRMVECKMAARTASDRAGAGWGAWPGWWEVTRKMQLVAGRHWMLAAGRLACQACLSRIESPAGRSFLKSNLCFPHSPITQPACTTTAIWAI